ncbi:MAG TPA: type II toxin-antitoxin system prevent-host-death family antitoxin [Polyangiaceae bacterium]|nr:type II toxin-antitoxin system prevent-host-death family antitoxin [Polyangiaceae bacterium]
MNIHEAKTQFSQLVDRAHAGEEIAVAKDGTPWARLVPLAAPATRKPGLLRGLRIDPAFDEPLPGAELDAWNGDR